MNQQTRDGYLTFVRHELRDQIAIIKEGVEQVINNVGCKGDEEKRNLLLGLSLNAAGEIDPLVGELLSPERFVDLR